MYNDVVIQSLGGVKRPFLDDQVLDTTTAATDASSQSFSVTLATPPLQQQGVLMFREACYVATDDVGGEEEEEEEGDEYDMIQNVTVSVGDKTLENFNGSALRMLRVLNPHNHRGHASSTLCAGGKKKIVVPICFCSGVNSSLMIDPEVPVRIDLVLKKRARTLEHAIRSEYSVHPMHPMHPHHYPALFRTQLIKRQKYSYQARGTVDAENDSVHIVIPVIPGIPGIPAECTSCEEGDTNNLVDIVANITHCSSDSEQVSPLRSMTLYAGRDNGRVCKIDGGFARHIVPRDTTSSPSPSSYTYILPVDREIGSDGAKSLRLKLKLAPAGEYRVDVMVRKDATHHLLERQCDNNEAATAAAAAAATTFMSMARNDAGNAGNDGGNAGNAGNVGNDEARERTMSIENIVDENEEFSLVDKVAAMLIVILFLYVVYSTVREAFSMSSSNYYEFIST